MKIINPLYRLRAFKIASQEKNRVSAHNSKRAATGNKRLLVGCKVKCRMLWSFLISML